MDDLTFGFFDTPMHEATAATVFRVLEAHGVTDIEFITGDKAEIMQELQTGQIDVFTTVWLPDVHKALAGSTLSMKAIGNLYQPSLFLALPQKFKEQITSIDQLTDSAEIDHQVIVPETVFEYVQGIFEAYGLVAAGYVLKSVEDEDAFSVYQEVLAAQQPKLIVLFQPNFLDESEALYKLIDSKGLLGKEQQASILLSKRMIDAFGSDLVDELEEMMLGNQVVKAMEQAMRRGDVDAHEAAEAWQRGKLIVRI